MAQPASSMSAMPWFGKVKTLGSYTVGQCTHSLPYAEEPVTSEMTNCADVSQAAWCRLPM